MLCEICRRSLEDSQESALAGVQYKSCPCCSQAAKEHIYYLLDDQHFGFSELRKTPKHPDGRQSHCRACREDRHTAGECTGEKLKYSAGKTCADFLVKKTTS